MNLLATIVGLLVVALGVMGVTAPDELLRLQRVAVTPSGLYVVAVLRVCMGLVLFFAAPASRMPRTLRVFGGIVCIAGIATPMFGVNRSHAVVNWWAAQGPLFIRLEGLGAAALGGFIIYSMARGPTPATERLTDAARSFMRLARSGALPPKKLLDYNFDASSPS